MEKQLPHSDSDFNLVAFFKKLILFTYFRGVLKTFRHLLLNQNISSKGTGKNGE
jgi:hypothetical protein